MKRMILAEQEQRKKYNKKDLLLPLEYIAQNNYITFNKKQFKQTKGIPQGLCVSYILSSFYYATLEQQALKFLRKNEVGYKTEKSNFGGDIDVEMAKEDETKDINCLMRLTDDYLLMTTSKDEAV